MLVRRTLNPTFLNTVANHPQVRPMVGGEGPLDLSALIADPANIALEAEHGGWVLARHEPGIYELHTLFTPAGRGRACRQAARAMLAYVFTATDAREIVTRVPAHNRGAAFAAALFGFEERFSRENAFRTSAGETVSVSYQALSLDRWIAGSPDVLGQGHWFHAKLEGAKAGSALPTHADDPAHDRAVGAAILMIRAGNPRKGVWAYNRWARLAGYAPIALITENPLVIDVRDAVIEVRDGAMEVLLCR